MKRMKLETALKTRSQKALGASLGISQSYINKLRKLGNCWLYLDEKGQPQRIEYTRIITVERRPCGE